MPLAAAGSPAPAPLAAAARPMPHAPHAPRRRAVLSQPNDPAAGGVRERRSLQTCWGTHARPAEVAAATLWVAVATLRVAAAAALQVAMALAAAARRHHAAGRRAR
eukprot:scaffold101370_cov56-Phaeocystis_antarctica.AAC.2